MTTVARYAEKAGRPAITYDQLGCGESSALKEKSPDFWQIEIFVKEFNELISQLGIAENFALIGHSWGGLLAAEIAITRPKGLKCHQTYHR
jgi:L-proline amide hydrolase